jgi:hypothetical protein
MKKLKKFKDFKKRKKTVIKKINDVPYNWVHTFDKSSPAPSYQIAMKPIILSE